MTKSELEPILDQLIALGEEADELNYWRDIFDDLPEDKQQEIAKLYQEELAELQKVASTTATEPSPETQTLQAVQQQSLAYLDEVEEVSREDDHALAEFAGALDEEKANELRTRM